VAIVLSQAVTRIREAGEPRVVVAVAIGTLSACLAVLFIARPSIFTLGLFATLMVAAFLRPDFCVCVSIFLLPWHPLVDLNLPIRDVSMVLHFVLFVGIWVRLRRRGRSIYEWLLGSKLKKGILLFSGIASVSFFRSGLYVNLDSFRPLVLMVSYVAFFFVMDGWLENEAQVVRVLKLLMASTIGVALFGFYQAIEGGYTDLYFQLYPLEEDVVVPWSGRITSFVSGFNSLAGYLNLVIPFAIGSAVLAKDRSLRFLGLVCACAAAVAMVLTQSRGGLLALAGILLIAVWFLVPRLTARIKLIAGGLLACVLLLPPLLNHFERLQGLDDPEATSRVYVWAVAAKFFLEHPLLGVGYGDFRFLSPEFVPGAVVGTLDAHNLYLQLLAETGVVGFLCFFVLLVFLISLALKSIGRQDRLSRIVAFGVLGAIAGTLIHGMVDFLFRVSPQFGALFWIILGLGSRTLVGTSSKRILSVTL
jgi:O-antigen ligase